MKLIDKIKFKMLVRRINWIGNHILVNGSVLVIERESDEVLHANIKNKGDE